MHGPSCIFWANLTPFSLGRAASKKATTGIGGKDLGYEHDARRSCCRYTSDHNAINCDAAR